MGPSFLSQHLYETYIKTYDMFIKCTDRRPLKGKVTLNAKGKQFQ